MRALNLFIFLFLFFGAISSANAQTSCYYADNISTKVGDYLTYNYTISFDSLNVLFGNTTMDMQLSNTYYFPTYMSWSCNRVSYDYPLYINYKIYDKFGNCTVSGTAVDAIGLSGVIYDNNTSRQIGSWVYYKNDNLAEFYAAYTEYPIGHTLYYLNNFGFPTAGGYCAITGWYVRYPSGFRFSSTLDFVSNFAFRSSVYSGPVWNNILGAVGQYFAGNNLSCTFTMRYISVYNISNLIIYYYPDTKLLNVSFIPNFDGFLAINSTGKGYMFNFSRNVKFSAFIPYINSTINIYDAKQSLLYTLNLKPKLSCLDEPVSGIYMLKLKDLAGNQILNFKIIYTNNIYISDSNGAVTVPSLINANITVLPFFRSDLAFNTTVTTAQAETWLTAPVYVYTVKIKARYVPLTGGELPIGFNYAFNGQEYADKVNLTNPSIAVGGTAYDNATVQLLAGNYQLTLKTTLNYLGADLLTRQINYNLSLFDDNYYRELTWYTGLFGDSINQTGANMPILSVTVVDQNSKPVANAYIYLNDTNNTNLAIKSTDESGNAIFYVQSGQNYTISVYYNNVFKATKTVYYPADQLAVQVNFQIYISAAEAQQGIPSNLTQEQIQNQISSILMLVLTNYAVWAFVFIIIFAAYAAKISGSPEIGILTAVICIGVFTFIVPWLPVQIIALIGVLAGVLLGLRIVRRSE